MGLVQVSSIVEHYPGRSVYYQGIAAGDGHDIMEAPLDLADSMVSKLRLSDSEE